MAMTCRGILALPYANRLCLVAGGQRRGQRDPLGPHLGRTQVHRLAEGGELILLSGVVTGDREGGLAVPAPGPL